MRAVVCGAGLAGLGVARLLAGAGWEVVVLERESGPRGGDFVIDFWGPGYDVAEALGLIPSLLRRAYPISEARFVDRAGHARAHLDYVRLRRAAGGRLLTLLRGDLEDVLRSSLGPRVEVLYRCAVNSVEGSDGGVIARLAGGGAVSGDLLVGADGFHSRVREDRFGGMVHLRSLGAHAAAYTFADPELSERLAGRVWVREGVGRFFGLYGIHGGRVAVLAVHRSAGSARATSPRGELLRVHASAGWLVPRALAHCPEPPALIYDGVEQVELPVWHEGRVVLVGDACQAVSLLAGQGASLALAGAWALATAVRCRGDLDDALRHYEGRMQPVVRAAQAGGRRMASWFVPPSRLQLGLRRSALRLLSAPVLGSRLMPAFLGGERGGSWVDPSKSGAVI